VFLQFFLIDGTENSSFKGPTLVTYLGIILCCLWSL